MLKSELIPVTAYGESLCRSCNGACCQRGTILELSVYERDFLIEGGAKIEDTGLPTRAQEETKVKELLGALADTVFAILSDAPEHPRYMMLEDCPYLLPQEGAMSACAAYEDPRKPSICDRFEAGSPQCEVMRESRYFNSPAEVV